jgi:hypothetical protein
LRVLRHEDPRGRLRMDRRKLSAILSRRSCRSKHILSAEFREG